MTNLDPETALPQGRGRLRVPGDPASPAAERTYLFLGASHLCSTATPQVRRSFLRSVVADASTRPDKALLARTCRRPS